VDGGEAPYFVDLVRDQLTRTLGTDADYNTQGLRIYTSLDPQLQHAANEAVAEGMKLVDAQVEKRRAKSNDPDSVPSPQVALIALNPHTGQILALVGGRNYGLSQLNHSTARRPTGSIFKPFVYAAAYNSSLAGTVLTPPATPIVAAGAEDVSVQQDTSTPPPPDPGKQEGIFTALTQLNNDESTFEGGYSPRNFHRNSGGLVTARYALQMSLNNATVELGQMVGFSNVAALARDAGIKSAQGTPAVALGAYDASPIDMAGAYTVFANGGVRIAPWMLASVRNTNGDVVSDYTPTSKPILDPRVAYLTTNLMQNVINAGTGYDVRRRGFMVPAAGKTGTSHDAWFAGFTSNLICVVWIGNDDYTDIKMEGAKAAAPIWAEFMKKAITLPQYADVRSFNQPEGVVDVRLDKITNRLATPSCPETYTIAFVAGTEPHDTCDENKGVQGFFSRIFGGNSEKALPPANGNLPGAGGVQADAEAAKKRKSFFGKIADAFKSDSGSHDKNPPPPSKPEDNGTKPP
jgi:penicillin-binding protein 1B